MRVTPSRNSRVEASIAIKTGVEPGNVMAACGEDGRHAGSDVSFRARDEKFHGSVTKLGVSDQCCSRNVTNAPPRSRRPDGYRTLTSGIGTTNLPPHSRMYAIWLVISSLRFQGNMKT